jgi:CheY-like chemotaxis protein
MLIRGLLGKWGCSVVLTSNGEEALQAYEDGDFDLILMDLQMPEMDGYQATSAIRRQETHSEKRTPVIALTAHAMKGDR